MTATRKTVIMTLIFAALAAGAIYVQRWVAIDRCLDSGGAWDYQSARCQGGAR